MYRFERLLVWQKSVEACQAVYELSASFPREERFGLTSQLRRAVVSIPTNIAEGTGDESDTEFVRFLRYALRSQHEAASLIKVSVSLGFVTPKECERAEETLASTGRLLHRLKRSLDQPQELRESPLEHDLDHDLKIFLRLDDNDPMTSMTQ
ncbi:MAG: four helix bundle protein [Thermoanaerobaculia bacterium]|nr:four helix bundle protein [Thermoanaerobaculia bacterium]